MLGLGAVIATSASGFHLLKWAAAAYLIYLGKPLAPQWILLAGSFLLLAATAAGCYGVSVPTVRRRENRYEAEGADDGLYDKRLGRLTGNRPKRMKQAMKLLVFQHIACEHPGSLRRFLADDGIEWDAVELDEGEPIPSLDGYDALWVMGGPMDVWDVDEHPWLVAEKAAIREWVGSLNKPFLGLCLGHQLLADALGGKCGPQEPPEIGVLDVKLTLAGMVDPLFKGTTEVQKCLQWHSVRVVEPPPNSTILAASETCPIQAMRVGDAAWSMQYHVEIETDTVANWAEIPAYHEALVSTLGADGYTHMSKSADEHMDSFIACAQTVYRNFITAIR